MNNENINIKNNEERKLLSQNVEKNVNIMNKIPKHVIVVLDGAYAEYVIQEDYDTGFSLVDEYENLITYITTKYNNE